MKVRVNLYKYNVNFDKLDDYFNIGEELSIF